MEKQIEEANEMIRSILEANDFLIDKYKSGEIGKYAYLLQDVCDGIETVNCTIFELYAVNVGVDLEAYTGRFLEENADFAGENEITDWARRATEILSKPPVKQEPAQQPHKAVNHASYMIDNQFYVLMENIKNTDKTKLEYSIKKNLAKMKSKNVQAYQFYIDFCNQYNFWGKLDPSKGIYSQIQDRVSVLKDHYDDFIWMYSRLEDYRSKKVFYGVLHYWLTYEWEPLEEIRENNYCQYFDLDLLQCDSNEVVVDLGAYIGDTAVDYVNSYGRDNYKRIYCYEIMPENVQSIHNTIDENHLKNIVVCPKGASDKSGSMFISTDTPAGNAHRLAENGQIEVPTAAIDDEIKELITLIKMDIEGAEQSALLGCKQHIMNEHPKLALSAYHNNVDLWKLARMVEEMDPTYHFYMRFYGDPNSIFPADYVLIGI
ncbi:MAG TPA: FkbM family methyltransferase [Oscillospiraceae bacterium]|nr:FkbM family methyltransferase [Oscillospiraceae bacterium]